MITPIFSPDNDLTKPADCLILPTDQHGYPPATWFDKLSITPEELKAGSPMGGSALPVGQAIFYLLRENKLKGLIGCCVMDASKPATEVSIRKAFYYGLLVAEANRMKTVAISLSSWMVTGLADADIFVAMAEILRRIQSETSFLETVIFFDSDSDRLKSLESTIAKTLF